MSEYDDNLDYDKIDFNKTKRGKAKNGKRRVSLIAIEGLILLVVVVAGAQFLFRDTSQVTDLQATIDTQNIQATANVQSQQAVLSAEQLFDRAMTEADNDDTLAALRSLDLALELDPFYADAYFERGNLNYELEKYYSASQDFAQAIEFNVANIEFAHYWRGRSNFQWTDYRQAERDFNNALSENINFTEAHYWLGRTEIELGQYIDGIAGIKQALDMGYDQLEFAYFFIANAYDDIDEYELAIEYYDLSLAEVDDECERYLCWIDYNNRATAYYRLEDYDRAVEDYTRAIQVNPDEYPLAMKNRADAYEQLGEMRLAMSDRSTMFQLVEGEIINRTLSDETNTLRVTLDTLTAQAHVKFEGTAGDRVTISVVATDDSDLDPMILLRDPDGSAIAFAENPDDFTAVLENVVLAETGMYTLIVASDLGESYGDFQLTISQ